MSGKAAGRQTGEPAIPNSIERRFVEIEQKTLRQRRDVDVAVVPVWQGFDFHQVRANSSWCVNVPDSCHQTGGPVSNEPDEWPV